MTEDGVQGAGVASSRGGQAAMSSWPSSMCPARRSVAATRRHHGVVRSSSPSRSRRPGLLPSVRCPPFLGGARRLRSCQPVTAGVLAKRDTGRDRRDPPPFRPLGELVTSVAYRAGEQPRTSVEKILPGPETGLWVNLNRDAFRSFGADGQARQVPGAMASGPASRATVIDSGGARARGRVLRARGGSLFSGRPVSVLRDDLVPLPELWGRTGACLRERLLEAATPGAALTTVEEVLRSFLTGPGPDPAVTAAAGALDRGVAVGEVADRLGLLPRTLRRRFTAQVGLTPSASPGSSGSSAWPGTWTGIFGGLGRGGRPARVRRPAAPGR